MSGWTFPFLHQPFHRDCVLVKRNGNQHTCKSVFYAALQSPEKQRESPFAHLRNLTDKSGNLYKPKTLEESISQGQGIYFSRPEKHPFSGRKSTQFSLKNHYILWFHPSFFFKTTIRHLNYRSLMCCCGGIDANNINFPAFSHGPSLDENPEAFCILILTPHTVSYMSPHTI